MIGLTARSDAFIARQINHVSCSCASKLKGSDGFVGEVSLEHAFGLHCKQTLRNKQKVIGNDTKPTPEGSTARDALAFSHLCALNSSATFVMPAAPHR